MPDYRLSEKVTTLDVRKHNEALTLSAIYDHTTISRAELARLLNISRPTVTELTQIMMQRELLTVVGPEQGVARVGKPPELLSLNPDAYHLLVADLSGKKLVCALMNLRLQVLQTEHTTISGQPTEIIESLITLLKRLEQATTRPILGIAISSPGIIDSEKGIVHLASNLGWEDVPLGDMVAERFTIPVHVGNDANLAALSEYRFGSGRNLDRLVVVMAEVGLGVGIILKGTLLGESADGIVSLGHVPLADPADQCTCGNYGCLETIVSEWGIMRQAQRVAQQHPTSQLNHCKDGLNAAVVWQVAQSGDAQAKALMARVSDHFGRALATMINLFAPDRIVLTGSLSQLGNEFLQDVRTSSYRHSLRQLGEKVDIVTSQLGDTIHLIGAGVLLLEKELSLWRA